MDLLNLFVKIGVKDEASEAVESVSGNIIGKLGKAAATAAKALAGMWAVKKVVDFGKAAFDAYASFEQLQGGVAKLYGNANMELDEYIDSMKSSGKSVDELTKTYQRNEKAQKLMMQQASDAWKTAGMDANTYMEQATSMSAALINSLGGDTVKAAEQTDVAMKAISDNVNTFGTDMASVSQAFMGFSKQNYTMLDNLKLGYGGTKTEMERLIADANEWGAANGKASDLSIDSFSDVVTAIQQIQEKQGIAGTTTKEAMTTIEGSMNATKAAWQNLVAEFGKPDADIGARISDMFTALMGEGGEGGLVRNVTSEVGVIATNIINAVSSAISTGISYISSNGPTLVSKAMDAIGNALDSAISGLSSFAENFDLVGAIFGEGGAGDKLSKVGEFVGKIGDAIAEKWPEIQEKLGQLWDTLVTTFQTVMPQVMEVAGRLVTMAGQAIAQHGPEILAKVGEVIGKVIAHIGTFAASMAQKGHEFMAGLITGTSDEGKKLHEWFANFFPDGLLKGLGDFATFLLDAGKALINGLLDGIGEVAPEVEEAIRGAFQTVLDFFGGVADFISDPIGAIKNGLDSLGGAFSDTESDVSGSMKGVEGSVDRSMGNAGKSLGKYNGIKLTDKKATATVTGNAQDGKAKTSVENTSKAVRNLSGKSISVSASGNVVSGVAESAIRSTKSVIDKLKDKAITVTTHQKTTVSGPTKADRARGGIRRHARGDIMVANRYTEGVPLDIVGEAGPEAIVPLTSHYGHEFARIMGAEAGKYIGGHMGGGNSYNLYYSGEQSALDMFDDLTFRMQVLEAMGD
jgi:phage-related protein